MAKINRRRRAFEHAKRRQRHVKLQKLRKAFMEAKELTAREAVIAKIEKVSPQVPARIYLGLDQKAEPASKVRAKVRQLEPTR